MDVGCQALLVYESRDRASYGTKAMNVSLNLHRYLRVAKKCSRTISSSTRSRTCSVYLDPTRSNEISFKTSPLDLTHAQRVALNTALRVDQAGEIAANWIYKGQMVVLGHDPRLRSLIQVSSKCVHYCIPRKLKPI